MLNSMAGQTTLTAAFVDDIFSLVLLVLLRSLAAGSASTGWLALRTVLAFAFLIVGGLLAKYVFPRVVPPLLARVPESVTASIKPRDEVHLTIMLLALVGFSAIGDLIGSHLLGAFVAGMCFTDVPMSHHIWTSQLKRILKWLVRIFFAATVGFGIPVNDMLTVEAFSRGAVIGLLPGILCKLASGLAARLPYRSAEQRKLAAAASPFTCGGAVQPLQYLVGTSMIARGELAFMVALSASQLEVGAGTGVYMLSKPVYAANTWGLLWALISAPFLFKWALGTYARSAPVHRAKAIGGDGCAGQDFVIRITGEHHSGMLHEVLDTLHCEGLDVLEADAHIVGGEKYAERHTDCETFVVRPRGKHKDFDDEKVSDIKHHLMEILGQTDSEIDFRAIDPGVPLSAAEDQQGFSTGMRVPAKKAAKISPEPSQTPQTAEVTTVTVLKDTPQHTPALLAMEDLEK